MTITDFDNCTTTSQMASVTARHFAHRRNLILIQPIIILCSRPSMRSAIDRDDPRLLIHSQSGQPLFAALAGAALALSVTR